MHKNSLLDVGLLVLVGPDGHGGAVGDVVETPGVGERGGHVTRGNRAGGRQESVRAKLNTDYNTQSPRASPFAEF